MDSKELEVRAAVLRDFMHLHKLTANTNFGLAAPEPGKQLARLNTLARQRDFGGRD